MEEIDLDTTTKTLQPDIEEDDRSKIGDVEKVYTESGKQAARGSEDLLYGIKETPPWPLAILLGFQQYLTAFGSTLSVPLVLAGPLCIGADKVGLGELIATTFFMSGITTLLQVTLGVRLPIIQGATFSFLAPTVAILNLPQWACPVDETGVGANVSNIQNITEQTTLTLEQYRDEWHLRIREIQGAICVASLFQILLGASGLISTILRYVGPLTITPTVTLVGLSLFEAAAQKAATQWWIAFTTLVFIALFCQYLKSLEIPVPIITKTKKCSAVRLPIFKLFPILLAMLLSWFLCFLLTVTNALPATPGSWGIEARTDARLSVLRDSRWIRVPYPGQWGAPTVSVGAVFGMLAGVIASIMESIGDYYACARLSGAPPPPPSAVNRGIAMEGIGCLLTGLFGTGNGTTSYSENVGAIGITKVGSRRVVICAGFLLIIMGCVGKVGALFVTIPDPVVGGMFIAMFGMITAIGLSNLQYVDLRSSRNIFIIAFSLFVGLCFPHWISNNRDSINTGNDIVDQLATVLCSTSMFVGGFIGFILDLTLPGTLEERGIIQWREDASGKAQGSHAGHNTVYDFPKPLKFLKKFPFSRIIPLCPNSDVRIPVITVDEHA